MTRRIITTANGERMVVLPETEFVQLLDAVENAEDVAAFDDVKRKLAAGEEELIPVEYVYRMLDGENRVAIWRQFRGLNGKELAKAAGITPGYLSHIESGKRDGTIGTMKRIAEALKVTIDDLV